MKDDTNQDKKKKVGMKNLKFSIIVVKHLIIMNMNIEISLTSRSKNQLLLKKIKRKNKTHSIVDIYIKKKVKNIHVNNICGFKSMYVKFGKL